ncbi:hypothetical protein [Pseudonocardia sp. GCM10023141]|uniref:hypothetical protein n=1 Tax=Pseudonocardia sp. GCM10023141 TaxID=3252653 RepID=UPI00361B69B7
MTVSYHRAALIAAATAAAAVVLAGCGSSAEPNPATLPLPATISGTPTPAPGTPSAPPTVAAPVPQAQQAGPVAPAPPSPVPAPAVALPWPVSGSARVGQLQSEVDGGAQPWLLDPTEVGSSYAAAAHGWNDTRVTRDGIATVTVQAPDGKRLVLKVVQPGRTGPGGIWTVTAETTA